MESKHQKHSALIEKMLQDGRTQAAIIDALAVVGCVTTAQGLSQWLQRRSLRITAASVLWTPIHPVALLPDFVASTSKTPLLAPTRGEPKLQSQPQLPTAKKTPASYVYVPSGISEEQKRADTVASMRALCNSIEDEKTSILGKKK